MPVRHVLWEGGAVLLQDKAVMLMLYEVEKFKYVTSVLYSVLFSEEQLLRYVRLPGLTADLQPEACVSAGRAGPLENQGRLFGDDLTVEGGYWCRICTEGLRARCQ